MIPGAFFYSPSLLVVCALCGRTAQPAVAPRDESTFTVTLPAGWSRVDLFQLHCPQHRETDQAASSL